MKRLYLLGLIFLAFGNFSQASLGGHIENASTRLEKALENLQENLHGNIHAVFVGPSGASIVVGNSGK